MLLALCTDHHFWSAHALFLTPISPFEPLYILKADLVMAFVDLVHEVQRHAHDHDGEAPKAQLVQSGTTNSALEQQTNQSKRDSGDISSSSLRRPTNGTPDRGSLHVDTPALRTGPPRSISYSYSYQRTVGSRQGSNQQQIDGLIGVSEDSDFPFMARADSQFRGALEYNSPEQREREKEAAEKKGKKR